MSKGSGSGRRSGASTTERMRHVLDAAAMQGRQGRSACSTGIVAGSGVQQGGRRCRSGDGTGRAGQLAKAPMAERWSQRRCSRRTFWLRLARLCSREEGKQSRGGRKEGERES